MRNCLQCDEPLSEDARSDASYCSTECKLKAQRQRKKSKRQTAPDRSLPATAPSASSPPAPAAPSASERTPAELAASADRPLLGMPVEQTHQLSFFFGSPASAGEAPQQPHPQPQPIAPANQDAQRHPPASGSSSTQESPRAAAASDPAQPPVPAGLLVAQSHPIQTTKTTYDQKLEDLAIALQRVQDRLDRIEAGQDRVTAKQQPQETHEEAKARQERQARWREKMRKEGF